MTNNSPDLLCFNVLSKNAWLPGISANSNKNYRHYTFQDFANFLKTFGNIKFLENSHH